MTGAAFDSCLKSTISIILFSRVILIFTCSCSVEFEPGVCLFSDARSGPDAGVQHALRPVTHHGAAVGGKPHGQRQI